MPSSPTSSYPRFILRNRSFYVRFSVSDKGHADVWDVHGHVVTLNARIVHDNWKPISLWLIKEAQVLQREVAWTRVRKTGLVRWLRVRPPLMPIVVFLYCLFGKGVIFKWPRGNILCTPAHGGGGRAFSHAFGRKVARPAARSARPAPEDY
jgi:hypothetical protein